MIRPRRLLPLVFALCLAGGMASAGPAQRPIVVELYTSQGCASCPPADLFLGKLADQPGIIAISLPITYWDMLGWKDTLASDANTRRQKAYAAAMGHGGVYTPQVIVDGAFDIVGSRTASIEAAIAERRSQIAQAMASSAFQISENDSAVRAVPATLSVAPATKPLDLLVPVSVVETPQEMHIEIPATPGARSATIWMFHLRSAVNVKIGSGENAGRNITYRNVAGDVKAVGVYKGKAMSLTLPRASMAGLPHDGVAVVVQQGGYGHVLGAAFVSRPDYYAAR